MTTESKTLLIVDDDTSLVYALSMYLDELGYAIHKAYTGPAGEQKAIHKQPDAYVTKPFEPARLHAKIQEVLGETVE